MKKNSWNAGQLADVPSAEDTYPGILRVFLSSCNHPEREYLLGLVRSRSYKQLLEWSDNVDPQMYTSADTYYLSCQIAALVRKYPFSPSEVPGIDPVGVAERKFFAAEHRCKRTNQRARARRKHWNHHAQAYGFAREYILKVIGETPDLPDILGRCDFTAGASLGVHGNRTNAMRKIFASRWSVTPSALPYAMTALWLNSHVRDMVLPGRIKCYDPREFEDLVRKRVELTSCNKVTFVPKTAKTHRSIAVEPLLNGFVQKGIDLHLRDRLRKVGIDLGDQARNQRLAMLGSVSGFNPWCTLDLAAASDSLSVEVCRDLLPPDWFAFLDETRSPSFLMNDSAPQRYEKFVSMGNGFCFPLQTLVFSSLCYAVGRILRDQPYAFSVYGDDIIIRQNKALLLTELLAFIGFRTNTDKTFITGNFRESCGADWYDGQDVRPVILDQRMELLPHFFAFHNATLRSVRVEIAFAAVRTYLRSQVGGSYLRPGREPGDTCYSVPLDVAVLSHRVRWDRNTCNWRWDEVAKTPVKDRMGHLSVEERASALMYAALRGSPSNCPYAIRYKSEYYTKSVSRPWYDQYHGGEYTPHQDASLRALENLIVPPPYGRRPNVSWTQT